MLSYSDWGIYRITWVLEKLKFRRCVLCLPTEMNFWLNLIEKTFTSRKKIIFWFYAFWIWIFLVEADGALVWWCDTHISLIMLCHLSLDLVNLHTFLTVQGPFTCHTRFRLFLFEFSFSLSTSCSLAIPFRIVLFGSMLELSFYAFNPPSYA